MPGVIRPAPQNPSAVTKKHRQRVGWIVGIGVLALGSIAAAAIFSTPGPEQNADQPTASTGSSASTDTRGAALPAVPLPSGAGGLVLLNASQSQPQVARMQQYLASDSHYKGAVVGAYGKNANSDETMILVIESVASLSAADQNSFAALTPLDVVERIVDDAKMTNVTSEVPSQPASVAMSCGTLMPASNVSVLTCVWDDSRDFGFGYFFSATSMADAAQYTDALRVAAETS